MKQYNRRGFLKVTGTVAATAALASCGAGGTESEEKVDYILLTGGSGVLDALYDILVESIGFTVLFVTDGPQGPGKVHTGTRVQLEPPNGIHRRLTKSAAGDVGPEFFLLLTIVLPDSAPEAAGGSGFIELDSRLAVESFGNIPLGYYILSHRYSFLRMLSGSPISRHNRSRISPQSLGIYLTRIVPVMTKKNTPTSRTRYARNLKMSVYITKWA